MLAAACRIFARLAPGAAPILWACAVLAAGSTRTDQPLPQSPGSAANSFASPLEAAFSARAGESLRLSWPDGQQHFFAADSAVINTDGR